MSTDTLLFGIHPVARIVLEQADRVLDVYWDQTRGDTRLQQIIDSAKGQHIKVHVLTKEKLENMVGSKNHQGIVVRLAQAPAYSEKDILQLIENDAKALVVILDCVQDPHNLGACMRSALALGATALIFPQDKSCPMNATVSKVAAGAAERLPFLAVKNLARFMQLLKAAGVWCVGMSVEADKLLHEIDLRGPIALVMGSEGVGLRYLTEKNCDYFAKISLIGPMESLNVSVATGISLYEVCRQRLFS